MSHLLVVHSLNVEISTALLLVHVSLLILVLHQTADLNAQSIPNAPATKLASMRNVETHALDLVDLMHNATLLIIHQFVVVQNRIRGIPLQIVIQNHHHVRLII